MCQSRTNPLVKCGYSAISLVYNSCLQLQLLEEDDKIGLYVEGQSVEQVWLAWRFRETRRRTGLFIWVRIARIPAITTLCLAGND